MEYLQMIKGLLALVLVLSVGGIILSICIGEFQDRRQARKEAKEEAVRLSGPSPLQRAGFKSGDKVLCPTEYGGTGEKIIAKIDCDCSAHTGGNYVRVRWSNERIRNDNIAGGFEEPGTSYARIEDLQSIKDSVIFSQLPLGTKIEAVAS